MADTTLLAAPAINGDVALKLYDLGGGVYTFHPPGQATDTKLEAVRALLAGVRGEIERTRRALDGCRIGVAEWHVADGTVMLSGTWLTLIGHGKSAQRTSFASMWQRLHAEDRAAMWARIGSASFLTDAEKRQMLGIGEGQG